MEARVAKLEATTEAILRDTQEIKADIRGLRGELSGAITRVSECFDKVHDRFGDVSKSADSNYKWIIGGLVVGFLALLSLILATKA